MANARKEAPTPESAFAKACRYCAYQERSHQEVRTKLFELGLKSSVVDDLLSRLITDGFLNEERFAKSFTGGKFRIKKWGRLKIKRELARRGLTKNCVASGLKEIDSNDYSKTLQQLLTRKLEELKASHPLQRRHKAARFAIARGFEPELVWESVMKLLPE